MPADIELGESFVPLTYRNPLLPQVIPGIDISGTIFAGLIMLIPESNGRPLGPGVL